MHRYLLVIAALAVALTLPAAGSGHGDFTLSSFGSATIDGQLSAGEWPATGVTFALVGDGGGTATLYAMNDASTLYLAAQFPTSASFEQVFFSFDNDHDGSGPQTELGDDVLMWDVGTAPSHCPTGCDLFYVGGDVGLLLDTAEGGTHDLTLARAAAGGTTTVEFAHPLDSADDAHDFSLAGGDTVTVRPDVTSVNGSTILAGSVEGDITIASPPAASAQIEALREHVADLELHHGLANALDSKLQAALAALEDGDSAGACGSLQALLNQVRAQSGKKLTEDQAEELTDAANDIRTQLDC
jgi:hypothetical protein